MSPAGSPMEELINKYYRKLIEEGLCEPEMPLIGAIDAELVWNRNSEKIKILKRIIKTLNINSILFSKPSPLYHRIINYLAKNAGINNWTIYPEDCETRTFLHDIPVSEKFNENIIIEKLKRRRSLIIADHGLITYGTVSPEQAYVTYSSVCFSGFIKIMVDYYYSMKRGDSTDELRSIIKESVKKYESYLAASSQFPQLKGPFKNSNEIINAIVEAGKLVIHSRLVDSHFGNISYCHDGKIYISQTGSSLDELEGTIDICPLDNSTCNAITASSEFSAHKSIYNLSSNLAILHGHPKFAVIMSMICDKYDCLYRGKCHTICHEKRSIRDIPVVPGEIGTGETGLYKTLPPALTGRGAIVYGHGLFTVGKQDFTDAYKNLLDIELDCLNEYKVITGIH